VKTPRYLLATRSEGKLREMLRIFSDFDLRVVALSTLGISKSAAEDNLESFQTFEENALAKARYFFEVSGGLPTFADDSGMCVDALKGEPGIFSKRWSGRDDLSGARLDAANNKKLVKSLRHAREIQRLNFDDGARYVAVAAFKDAEGESIARGEIEGRVLETPRGQGGFGYDPYFEAPDLGGTFAEATLEKTASTSHRSRAFRALLSALRAEGRI